MIAASLVLLPITIILTAGFCVGIGLVILCDKLERL